MFLCINTNFIIICSLTNFNKNRTNSWKNTKLWGTHYQYLNNHKRKLHALRSLVLELLGSIFLCIYINFIITCSLTGFNKNQTNEWKNIKLWGSHYQYLNNLQPKDPCFRHFGSWVIRFNVSLYKYEFYNYMLFDAF